MIFILSTETIPETKKNFRLLCILNYHSLSIEKFQEKIKTLMKSTIFLLSF